MGRTTKITREMILEAAYELLDESGIGAVAIKSIAERLGCSTQPVSWQFGSMTELKKELFDYAGEKLYGSLSEAMEGKDAIEAFYISGKHYLSCACDHPHVFRFVNVDDTKETIGEKMYGEKSIFDLQFDEEAFIMLSKQYDAPAEEISKAVRDTVIYTHGLAVMMMFDSYRLSKEEAVQMMYDVGLKMLKNIGIAPPEKPKEITCPPGIQLSAFLRSRGYKVPTPCGGRGNCGKCRVKVTEGSLKITAMDKIQLSEAELKEGVRLACQAMPEDTVKIEIL